MGCRSMKKTMKKTSAVLHFLLLELDVFSERGIRSGVAEGAPERVIRAWAGGWPSWESGGVVDMAPPVPAVGGYY